MREFSSLQYPDLPAICIQKMRITKLFNFSASSLHNLARKTETSTRREAQRNTRKELNWEYTFSSYQSASTRIHTPYTTVPAYKAAA